MMYLSIRVLIFINIWVFGIEVIRAFKDIICKMASENILQPAVIWAAVTTSIRNSCKLLCSYQQYPWPPSPWNSKDLPGDLTLYSPGWGRGGTFFLVNPWGRFPPNNPGHLGSIIWFYFVTFKVQPAVGLGYAGTQFSVDPWASSSTSPLLPG